VDAASAAGEATAATAGVAAVVVAAAAVPSVAAERSRRESSVGGHATCGLGCAASRLPLGRIASSVGAVSAPLMASPCSSHGIYHPRRPGLATEAL